MTSVIKERLLELLASHAYNASGFQYTFSKEQAEEALPLIDETASIFDSAAIKMIKMAKLYCVQTIDQKEADE